MKKMYLIWAMYWPAHNYETLGVSLHLQYTHMNSFSEKRFNELRKDNKQYLHPSDGFGKPLILEVDKKVLTLIKDDGIYMENAEYQKYVATGSIIKIGRVNRPTHYREMNRIINGI